MNRKNYKWFKIAFTALILSFGTISCQQEESLENGAKGKFMLDLRADLSYDKSTKAVDESTYTNLDNYTVELIKDASVVKSFLYKDMPLMNDLTAGTYTLKAYCGENIAAGYDKLYVEGSQTFSLYSGETKNVNFTCIPANVKINLKYSDDFFTHFSDCSVDFKTPHKIGRASCRERVYVRV